jgi:hypothetical protein
MRADPLGAQLARIICLYDGAVKIARMRADLPAGKRQMPRR